MDPCNHSHIINNLWPVDTQFAYLAGIRDFVQNKSGYLQTQVGNPEGADKPNKKVGYAHTHIDE